MKLNDLKPNEGSKKKPKRLGHGLSAGQGKTGGRGTKGQGSRSGGSTRLYIQGGNLPFYRRLPFMRGEGFTPPVQVEYNEVNLLQLADLPEDKPLVLVAGSEVGGVDPGILAHCERVVCLPMLGSKGSLNVSVAFGIAAYTLRFGRGPLTKTG